MESREAGSQARIRVLTVGLRSEDLAPLSEVLGHCQITRIEEPKIENLMSPIAPAPQLILCGQPPKGVSLEEVGQLLSIVYHSVPLVLMCLSRDQHDASQLLSNGFSEVYLSPVEWQVVKKNLTDRLAQISQGRIKAYHPVKLLDVNPDTSLPFDTFIYFPIKNKYIHYSKEGDPIDAERAQNLVDHHVGTIYVKSLMLQSFYGYVTHQLLLNPSTKEIIGLTERRDDLKEAITQFYSKLQKSKTEPTVQTGKELTEELYAIAKQHILNSEISRWYLPLMNWTQAPYDFYSHATNVALYSAAIAYALGIDRPEDLAVAGILHDAGLINVPAEVQNKNAGELSIDETKLFQKHPEYSLSILRRRKVQLSERVTRLIVRHQERFNGLGYPSKISGAIITEEEQILAIVDTVDYVIQTEAGKSRITPQHALNQMLTAATGSQTELHLFDPEILKKIIHIFPEAVHE